MKIEEYDVVVVGAGLSGLRAALELSKHWKVAVGNAEIQPSPGYSLSLWI